MKLSHLVERNHYDPEHICKTPGAIYSTSIHEQIVSVSVKLPFELTLTRDQSEKLEADLHYAVEKVIAPLF